MVVFVRDRLYVWGGPWGDGVMVVLVEETGSLGLWFTVFSVLDGSFYWHIVNVYAYAGR